MQIVSSIEELFGKVYELTVGAVCPKCKRIFLSTTPDAKKILVFGCQFCGDIESGTLLKMNSPIRLKSSEGIEENSIKGL